MTSRRKKLVLKTLGKNPDQEKAQFLDTTLKVILADMANQFLKFWEASHPGVLCFQPTQKREVVFMTLSELDAARKDAESNNDDDLGETFRRIIEAASKIDPLLKGGFVINDNEGMRYIELDYEKGPDGST